MVAAVSSPSTALAKPSERSWAQSFIDTMRADMAKAPPVAPAVYLQAAGAVVAEYVEGGVVGSLLGAAHGKVGLDTRVGPIDGLVAAAGAVGSIVAAGIFPEAAAAARHAGSQALAILTFRRSYELVAHQPFVGGAAVRGVPRVAGAGKGPGIAGEDPIETLAKKLG